MCKVVRLVVLSALIAAALTGVAQAREVSKSSASLHYFILPPEMRAPAPLAKRNILVRFHGRVRSPEDTCEPRRQVILYGRNLAARRNLTPVDHTKTKTNGKFSIDVIKPPSGKYFVKVSGKRLGRGACRRTHSEDVDFSPF